MLPQVNGKFMTQRNIKKTQTNELMVPWKMVPVQWPDKVVHCMKAQVKQAPSDAPTVNILVASDERQRQRSEDRDVG
jgi:hypothetical protein